MPVKEGDCGRRWKKDFLSQKGRPVQMRKYVRPCSESCPCWRVDLPSQITQVDVDTQRLGLTLRLRYPRRRYPVKPHGLESRPDHAQVPDPDRVSPNPHAQAAARARGAP